MSQRVEGLSQGKEALNAARKVDAGWACEMKDEVRLYTFKAYLKKQHLEAKKEKEDSKGCP
uniref:Uncharacterized protein n=1 Tax=Cucumis melo TaxID=3656 RepID=A0A9I9DJC4_CUCME